MSSVSLGWGAACPIDTAINPGNLQQRYILWTNGRIDILGGAPAQGANLANQWMAWPYHPARAITITDWATGKGYILDAFGYEVPLNGEAQLTTDNLNGTFTNSNGLPWVKQPPLYVDWSWNPDGSGQGYVLTAYGELIPIGGAPNPPRTGPRFVTDSARKLKMQWSPTKKAIVMDLNGRLYSEFSGAADTSFTGWPGWDAARDFAVTDWTTTPNKGYVLDLYGGVTPFGGNSATVGNPYKVGGDNARTLDVINLSNPTELFQVWANGQQFDYFSSTAPTVVPGAGVSEVQVVTISGSPTGGTFTLTFAGQTTAATAYNASAATVQTNLQALSSIGLGNVTVTGSNGGPYTVTFTGALAMTNVAQMTTSASFTGGSSPSIAVTITIDGINASPANTVTTTTRPTLSWAYSDPQKDTQTKWEVYLFTSAYVSAHAGLSADPSKFASGALAYGTDTSPLVRGVVADLDLSNGTYTYFVRAMDTSGLWSAWASRSWTQSVTLPGAPAGLTAIANQTAFTVGLSATVVSPGSATAVCFQCSDDGGTTWSNVRGADALPLTTTTTATDYDPPLGKTRLYRAYAFGSTPRIASPASGTASATITRATFALTSAGTPGLGGEINVVEAPSWTRKVKAGVFEGIGAVYPTVVSDGAPKARTQSLTVDCNSKADFDLIDGLVSSNSTLVLRDPFGDVVYCRVVGDWAKAQQRRAPAKTETTPLRNAHKVTLPLVEIAKPVSTNALTTVPPGPAG